MWETFGLIAFGIFVMYIAIKLGFYIFILAISFLALLRKKLVEYCYAHKQSANPWIIVIWESLWLSELVGYRLMSVRLSRYEVVNHFLQSDFYSTIFIYMAIVFPFVILLLKARTKFLQVLLIKMICIPLDLIYVVYSFFDDEYKPERYKEEDENSYSFYEERLKREGKGRHSRRRTLIHEEDCTEKKSDAEMSFSTDFGVYTENNSFANDCETENYMSEKYNDLNEAMNSEETYAVATVGGKPVYSSSDVIPFDADLDSVREIDSDYAPFD